MQDRTDVGVFRRRRISTCAFQQHQLLATSISGCDHRSLQLCQRGHSGGDDQRFAGGGSLGNQRQMVVFETGDFVCRNIEIFQEVDSGLIKRRAKADQPS